MPSVDQLANVVVEVFTDIDDEYLLPVEFAPTTVDDPSIEDPAMVMSGYSEIESVRISYGTNEIYDIFVAKVK